MKLNLLERFTVLQILPQKGNFATLNIVRKLQEALAPSEEEFKKYEIKQDGDQTKWNKKGLEEVEIQLGEKAIEIVVSTLKELDKENTLTPQHLTIYEKFVTKKD